MADETHIHIHARGLTNEDAIAALRTNVMPRLQRFADEHDLDEAERARLPYIATFAFLEGARYAFGELLAQQVEAGIDVQVDGSEFNNDALDDL